MIKALFIILIVIVIIAVCIAAVSAAAKIRFRKEAKELAAGLLNGASTNGVGKIREEDLSALPRPVRTWLENAHIVGKERIITVRLKQKGRMRIKPGGAWMPALAEQYFRADEPGFIWLATVKMNSFLHLSGLDRYLDGRGKMKISLLSLFPVVNSAGYEIDVSTLLRYLAEMPWFPTAALNPYISWEAIDASSARAAMSYKGIEASGIFFFNEQGDPVRFTAKRYRETGGKYVLSDWGGVNTAFKEFNGVRIPCRSEIVWKEETEDFDWYKLEITNVDYNLPVVYFFCPDKLIIVF